LHFNEQVTCIGLRCILCECSLFKRMY